MPNKAKPSEVFLDEIFFCGFVLLNLNKFYHACSQKKLQDYVTIAFAKGAYYWAWRLAFFSGLFG